MGADEPSGAAAAGYRPCVEAAAFVSLSYRVSACLSYTLSEFGEKEYFSPSVFNLLAVDFFLPYEVEGTIEVKPQ